MPDEKRKRSEEDSSCWEMKANFQNITLWNHDSLPSENDASLRAFHLFSVATAVCFFLTLVTSRCLSCLICLIICKVGKQVFISKLLFRQQQFLLTMVPALMWHPHCLKYFSNCGFHDETCIIKSASFVVKHLRVYFTSPKFDYFFNLSWFFGRSIK